MFIRDEMGGRRLMNSRDFGHITFPFDAFEMTDPQDDAPVLSLVSPWALDADISDQLAIDALAVTGSSRVTGEFIFNEDAELDYSASLTNGMAAATVTFSELPTSTVAVLVYYAFGDTGATVGFRVKRSSGAALEYNYLGQWEDRGTNYLRGTAWVPTSANTIYVTQVQADTQIVFSVLGYKTNG